MSSIREKAIKANLELFNRKIKCWEEKGISYFFQNKEWYERANRTLEAYSQNILKNKAKTEQDG